jgi:hypothetical protein
MLLWLPAIHPKQLANTVVKNKNVAGYLKVGNAPLVASNEYKIKNWIILE